jgi:hypothetical protein
MNHLRVKNIRIGYFDKVAACGHLMYVLTKRIPRLRKGTVTMIKDFFGDAFSMGIHFVDHAKDKISIITKMNTNVWFDDDPVIFKKVSRETSAIPILISDQNTPYNHKLAKELSFDSATHFFDSAVFENVEQALRDITGIK